MHLLQEWFHASRALPRYYNLMRKLGDAIPATATLRPLRFIFLSVTLTAQNVSAKEWSCFTLLQLSMRQMAFLWSIYYAWIRDYFVNKERFAEASQLFAFFLVTESANFIAMEVWSRRRFGSGIIGRLTFLLQSSFVFVIIL